MKKVMQNKSLLHRLIALTMAVVMTLTLVAIDSHFHLFAEEEDTKAREQEIRNLILNISM